MRERRIGATHAGCFRPGARRARKPTRWRSSCARRRPISSWDVSIRAVDINPGALERAANARFSAWALRETPPEVQKRWFRPAGRDLVLADEIRSAVTFEQRNLTSDDVELWRPDFYDVIFCRNVIMYFSPEKMRAVIARIAASLAPGGYLFLGHAETLRGLSQDFHLLHTPRHLLLPAPARGGGGRAAAGLLEGAAAVLRACRRPVDQRLDRLGRHDRAGGRAHPRARRQTACDRRSAAHRPGAEVESGAGARSPSARTVCRSARPRSRHAAGGGGGSRRAAADRGAPGAFGAARRPRAEVASRLLAGATS